MCDHANRHIDHKWHCLAHCIRQLGIALSHLLILLSLAGHVNADEELSEIFTPTVLELANLESEAQQSEAHSRNQIPTLKNSWAFAFDNDVLVPGHRDQDYTYGLNFSQTGERATQGLWSLKSPLLALDKWIGVNADCTRKMENFSREFGVFGFTPEDITIDAANPLDRPYASLIYLSSSREQIDLVNNVSWKTTFTVGALGLGLVGDLQNMAHKNTNGTRAEGWNNQISEGGELTGRYVLARQKILGDPNQGPEIKSTWQASVGYLTEASWSVNVRSGSINSHWSKFNPDLTSYGEKSSQASNAKAIEEHYFWAGMAFKARAYNAFLQGQFRESAVTYAHHQLNPLLLEAWAGFTFTLQNNVRLSYVLRGHSSEINEGAGDRNLLWGGLTLGREI